MGKEDVHEKNVVVTLFVNMEKGINHACAEFGE